MAYPGQQWQQQHPQYNDNYQQSYGNQNWGPPPGAPPAGYGPVHANNDPNYPGQQYNQYGYIQGGNNPPYGQPRPYPPDQFGPPQGPPPQHYGYDNQQQYQQYAPPQQYQQGPVHFQPQYNQQEPFFYKYSDCSGSRKALLVGINYVGSSNALRGCHNDVRNVSRFLKERYNYKEQDMVILMDDPSFGPRQQPTRQNIIDAMRWLVAGAKPNDSLFFHYSGHGGQTKDLNGDEADGTDETVYPQDHQQAGMIVDDEMHDIMVRPLPAGCRLTAIFDSCHSGSALDLPYIYGTSGKIKEPNLLKDAGGATLLAVTKYAKGDLGGAVSSIFGLGKKIMGGQSGADEKTKMQNTSAADVIMWSGCKDDQTSADAQEAGQATGAMSYAFIASLTQFPQQSYMQLLNTVRDILKSKYSQKPQLSSSHPMDTNLLFVM